MTMIAIWSILFCTLLWFIEGYKPISQGFALVAECTLAGPWAGKLILFKGMAILPKGLLKEKSTVSLLEEFVDPPSTNITFADGKVVPINFSFHIFQVIDPLKLALTKGVDSKGEWKDNLTIDASSIVTTTLMSKFSMEDLFDIDPNDPTKVTKKEKEKAGDLADNMARTIDNKLEEFKEYGVRINFRLQSYGLPLELAKAKEDLIAAETAGAVELAKAKGQGFQTVKEMNESSAEVMASKKVLDKIEVLLAGRNKP